MRLLYHEEDGKLNITSDLVDASTIPPYAILSHTWGADDEEVTFDDLAAGAGKDKLGYEKIKLCGQQAKSDGSQYFWVDTCCINKASNAELSLAIRSMFSWYRNAARCYVYLSDVLASPTAVSPTTVEGVASLPPWDSDFRKCKWFTRGWTLQELLAPSVVEFFSHQWDRLGDRKSLKSQIHEFTTIPHRVLEGGPLSQCSVEERFRWRQSRHTKLQEDAAYSLSGIFDVELAPVYGEGTEEAFRRLRDEIRRREECLRDLRPTDPRDDKKRIEETKGGLSQDLYRWVLDNGSFQQWHNDPQNQLLWIKGDPGKGKTMLLCGIIDELQKTVARSASVSYFFCQATDPRINSATAVLRGLLYLLVSQQPALTTHVRTRYDQAGRSMFEDTNAWVALSATLADVLQDPNLGTTYIVIDALDECVSRQLELLQFVAEQPFASSRVKWIVSSRNMPDIEAHLEKARHKLSLELNAGSITSAVETFIEQKVNRLAQKNKYTPEVRSAVLEHLTSNAGGTFLWVALVCQDLDMTPRWKVMNRLALLPPGLDTLYQQMMRQIDKSDDTGICQEILATTAVLFRPVQICELIALVQSLEGLDNDPKSVQQIIGFCGSFLTLREDTVYFVHQSAQDFLFAKASDKIFPDGIKAIHHNIFSRSLATLSRTLHRDMYHLKEPGFSIDDVEPPVVDPLAASRYACIYWVDHLDSSKPNPGANHAEYLQVTGTVTEFLRKKYLYWLERSACATA